MKIGKVALQLAVWTLAILFSAPIFAQSPPPPPSYAPAQLDQLVARIALYPDPLLAQVLAGATYPDQIPDAASWADEHHYLTASTMPLGAAHGATGPRTLIRIPACGISHPRSGFPSGTSWKVAQCMSVKQPGKDKEE